MEIQNQQWRNESDISGNSSRYGKSKITHENKEQKWISSFTHLIRKEHDLETRSDILRSDSAGNSSLGSYREDGKVPVDICWSPGKGRYLVASRDITAGEVVFQESPLLLAPKPGSSPACLACLRSLQKEWVFCEKCSGPLCSTNCKGSGHGDEECRLIKCLEFKRPLDITTIFKELSVILPPLRMYLMMKESPVASDVINALQSHKENRRILPVGRFIENTVVKAFQSELGLDVDSKMVHHLCGVLDTNSFEVSIDDTSRVRAVFTLASMMNHSCLPNTQRWYAEEKMIVRAASDIPKGQPVTTSYTQTLWGTFARSTHLSTCKMFTCTCERCSDPTELGSHMSSISCKNCQDPEGLFVPPGRPSTSWKCRRCGSEMSADTIQAMVRASSVMLSRMDTENIEDASATLKHLGRLLGKQHYIVVEVKYAIIQAIMKQTLQEMSPDNLTWVMELTEDLLKLVNLIEPELSRLRGLLLLHRGQAYVELLKRSSEEEFVLKSAENDGDPSCGCSHVSRNIQSREYIKEMLGQMTECEFILQYDPRLSNVVQLSRHLRDFLSFDRREEDMDEITLKTNLSQLNIQIKNHIQQDYR